MAAKSDVMSLIHDLTAKEYLDMLTHGIKEVGKDGVERIRRPNAAELSSITKFLKDNGISADPEFNSTLKELSEELPFASDNVVNFRNNQ